MQMLAEEARRAAAEVDSDGAAGGLDAGSEGSVRGGGPPDRRVAPCCSSDAAPEAEDAAAVAALRGAGAW